MTTLLFSYSHRDEEYRNELEIHLAMLKRTGVITTWHDRRITAGSELNNTISEALNNASVILLLVSPYFLDSDYCYDIEMKRAMEKHERGESIVIPVILHPCDWHGAPFGKLMATPTDGKPVSKHANFHDAYLDITTSIKNAVMKLGEKVADMRVTSEVASPDLSTSIDFPRSSNLRIKKEFTEQDKHELIDDTFEYISKYFEGSLKELCNRNPQLTYRYKRLDAEHFSAFIYQDGTSVSECRIWTGSGSFLGDIVCSNNGNSHDNSCNDAVSVMADGQLLYFKPMRLMQWGRDIQNEKLTQEGAAEYFWQSLIEILQ